ncbi:MAG: hypothetical protein ACOZF0_10200 [Thermodesulfobacteriota bacterium]
MGHLEKFIPLATPPAVLYWYATPGELTAILNGKALAAPDIRYLNDNMELTYLTEIVLGEIHGITADSRTADPDPDPREEASGSTAGSAGETDGRRESVLREIVNRLTNVRYYHLFACYLFAEGDSFANWRIGGPDEKRYSLGFDSGRIIRLAGLSHFKLVKCIFDEAQQRRIIRDLLTESIREILLVPAEAPDLMLRIHNVADEFLLNCIQCSALFKHPAAFEGIVWCLLSMPAALPTAAAPLRFRDVNGLLAPYLEIKLTAHQDQVFPLVRLIVGPTPHVELAADSLELLLASQGLQGCLVEGSRGPYKRF